MKLFFILFSLLFIIILVFYKLNTNKKNIKTIKKEIKKILSQHIYNKYFVNISLIYLGKKLLHKKKLYHYGYVSFITGENYLELINGTIYSVHFFSIYPIILYISGKITTKMKSTFSFYDRLIVYSIPSECLSPYFLKLRVSLLAPVLVGQIVESDTIILPGADCLFKRIEKEINTHYPYPIMPRPPDIRGNVKGNGTFNPLDYPMNNRSMRYMHAHMSWTFESLRFIAYIYNKSFVYPYRDDEYALNVNLWERKANKQWCIYDPYYAVVDISENKNILYNVYDNITFFNFIHGCKSYIIQQRLLNKLKGLKYHNYKLIYAINKTTQYTNSCRKNYFLQSEINKEKCLM